MPIGEGFWVHLTGKTLPVHEHFSAVLASPRTYGVLQADTARLPGEIDDDVYRRRVLTLVLKKGWIRVRSHKGYTVFEAWKLTRRATDAICGFIDEFGAGDFAMYTLKDVSSGKIASIKGNRCYEDVDHQLHGVVGPWVSREKVYRLVQGT